jgi:hypothetical protein
MPQTNVFCFSVFIQKKTPTLCFVCAFLEKIRTRIFSSLLFRKTQTLTSSIRSVFCRLLLQNSMATNYIYATIRHVE